MFLDIEGCLIHGFPCGISLNFGVSEQRQDSRWRNAIHTAMRLNTVDALNTCAKWRLSFSRRCWTQKSPAIDKSMKRSLKLLAFRGQIPPTTTWLTCKGGMQSQGLTFTGGAKRQKFNRLFEVPLSAMNS